MIGFWLRNRKDFTKGKIISLSLLSLFTYLFHIISLVSGLFVIGILAVSDVAQNMVAGKDLNLKRCWAPIRKKVLPILVAALPVVLFIVAFLSKQGTGYSSG